MPRDLWIGFFDLILHGEGRMGALILNEGNFGDVRASVAKSHDFP